MYMPGLGGQDPEDLLIALADGEGEGVSVYGREGAGIVT
jgi:hypothetical protein